LVIETLDIDLELGFGHWLLINLTMPRRQKPIEELLSIMARLRSPRGCPWDREQTHSSIKQNLVEECYEAVDAIESRDDDALCEELGDLLLQVVFHAQMASEKRRFNFNDVARSIADKLVRRHPHVFSRNKLDTADQVLTQWHAIKKTESGKRKADRKSVLDGVPRHLPALMKAQEVQKKAARIGFDWKKTGDVMAKVDEELAELKRAMRRKQRNAIQDELGDLLFAVVNLARFQKFDAEDAVNQTTKKFRQRFEHIEREVARRGKRMEDCSLEELDAIWNQAKRKAAGNTRRRSL
jgi:tetrapyrrole methylase family protein/MazG family protein